MNKNEFLVLAKENFSKLGFKKHRNYWYKDMKEHTLCVFIQGSQWDANNYYVNIGLAIPDAGVKYPNLLQWLCRHRCRVEHGELNICWEELSECLKTFQRNFEEVSNLGDFLESHSIARIGNQYVI